MTNLHVDRPITTTVLSVNTATTNSKSVGSTNVILYTSLIVN